MTSSFDLIACFIRMLVGLGIVLTTALGGALGLADVWGFHTRNASVRRWLFDDHGSE